MGSKLRLLVIGADALRDSIVRALPNCDVATAERALDGVWKGGRERFDGAYVSLALGGKALRTVTSLRQVAPKLRIIVGCRPADEPLARRALAEGADDYVLEPIQPEDIEQAFGIGSPPAVSPAPVAPTPSLEEIVTLGDALRNLGDGAVATLDRLAVLLQRTFNAVGVMIQLDELTCSVGDAGKPVLEAVIRRQDTPIGRVALARRSRGTYAAATADRLAGYARLIEAVISQAREREHWRELAWTDDLSSLHNRRYFEQAFDELILLAADKRLRLTLLLFDIDDFKSYNDRFGHETGDQLIQEVAVLLKRCTRERDIVVRYGGDEFVVVFWDAEKQRVPGSEHPREPIELTKRFCQAIAKHDFQCLGASAPGPLTISGGLACFPWNGSTRAQLLSAADEALLTAKGTGKNCIYLAGQSSRESASPS